MHARNAAKDKFKDELGVHKYATVNKMHFLINPCIELP